MKKLLALVLTLAMITALAACGGSEEPKAEEQAATKAAQSNEEAAAPAAEKKIIGVSLPSPANQWVGALIEAAQAEAGLDEDEYDIKVVTSDNPSAQVAAIEDLMQDDLDVLVVLPIESAPLTPVCERVYDEGTKTIIVDRGIGSDKYTTFIAGDNYGIGVSAANYIGEKLGGEGKVVEILGVPCEIVTQRSEGFHDTIAEKYPNIEVVASATGNFSREPSLKAMEDILQAQDAIDAVYSHDDEQSLGIKIAVENAGREGEMFLTGAGGNKSVFELMQAGSPLIEASFIYSPSQGGIAVKVAKAMASGTSLEKAASESVWLEMSLADEHGDDYLAKIGDEVPRVITLSASTVTEDNVNDFYNPDSSY